mgnify:CR=1 FL=1
MKINNLIILTHIFFGIAIAILLIRVIFFGSYWIWSVINLAINLNTWASLERTKERIEMQKEIKRLKEKHGRNM